MQSTQTLRNNAFHPTQLQLSLHHSSSQLTNKHPSPPPHAQQILPHTFLLANWIPFFAPYPSRSISFSLSIIASFLALVLGNKFLRSLTAFRFSWETDFQGSFLSCFSRFPLLSLSLWFCISFWLLSFFLFIHSLPLSAASVVQVQIKFIFCLLRLPNLFFIIIVPPCCCSSFTLSKQSSSSARVRAAAGDGSVSQSSNEWKKKPNPLQQLLTLEWQLNVLKPFFSLRFFALFFACFLFDLVWFSFCCLLSSSSVFLAFLFLQAFTLSCSLFVLLFLMHVRPSQKGEQKKNQIQFEAHFFFNAHHKKMKTSWELFLVF